jgi:8-oxo-dGTP pyrophosphatase MutT (NUDIX family)
MKDLLLQDYRYVSELLIKNEQSGETRLNLFLGLITVTFGAIGALLTRGVTLPPKTFRWLVAAALVGLFVIGIATFLRMLTRNKATDQAKRQLDLIRESFRDAFDPADTSAGYELYVSRRGSGEDGADPRRKSRTFGGLASLVAILNAFLLAGACSVPLLADGRWVTGMAAAVIALAAAFAAQWRHADRQYRAANDDRRSRYPRATHAGAVVYRHHKNGVEYLLVKTKKGGPWVLPKGHIDATDVSARAAAAREVREEAGVIALPRRYLGRVSLGQGSQAVSTKFFLMEGVAFGLPCDPGESSRDPTWKPFEEAVEAIRPLPESCAILRGAEQVRRDLERETGSAKPAAVAPA